MCPCHWPYVDSAKLHNDKKPSKIAIMKRRHRLEQSLLVLFLLVVNICFIFTTNDTQTQSDLQLSQDVVDNNYDDGIITVATESVSGGRHQPQKK